MSDDSVSDGQLVAGCRNGDETAFDQLYQRYRLPLFSYLSKLLPGQSAVVDDLFQKTWIRVLDALPAYTERQRFVSWLFRIAHNLAMDHFRREGRAEMVDIEDSFVSDGGLPWEDIDRKELLGALDQAIGRLSDVQREVVLLRQQRIPFREIADIQQVGINTVLGRMHYAVLNLRKAMREWIH